MSPAVARFCRKGAPRRLLPYLGLAILLIAGGAAAWQISSVLQRRADGMTRYVRVDAWAVQQVEFELQQFRALFARHVAGDAGTTIDDVRHRLALLRGTLPLLHASDADRAFHALVDIDGTAGIVGDAIDAAEALLAGSTGGHGDLALLAAVDHLLTEPTGRLRQLAIDVSSLRAELQDGDLANVRWLIGLNRDMLIAFGAVALAFIMLLVKEAREARHAERRAVRNEERTRHVAAHDPLTELPNRTVFQQRLGDALTAAERRGDAVELAVLGLDRFKDINDAFGHELGDALLKAVADRLRTALPPSARLLRVGGDEFAIIAAAADARQPALDSVLASFGHPFTLEGRQLQIGSSIGIARFPADGRTQEDLLKAAELALSVAKAAGGNAAQTFLPEMRTERERRKEIEDDLRQAIAEHALMVYLQPQVHLGSGRCLGAEALLRWRHPRHGWLSPATFIPIAEESGLILPLGRWVMENACAQALDWQGEAADGVIAVNVSPAQFVYGDIVADVRAVLARTGLPAPRLELEITEGLLMQDAAAATKTLHQLDDLGVQVAVDDFGTGYSSLSYLKRFKVHKLKVDQSFVRDIESDYADRSIVRAIINLAASRGLRTIAEGIETPTQRLILAELGCEDGQGYLFARPMPAADFLTYATTRAEAAAGTRAA
jgi:diguanylate cyclase (GGDEF)-like protein